MKILGVMSGSSLDGLDLAIVEFFEENWGVLYSDTVSYTDEWVSRLQNYSTLSALDFVRLEKDYSTYIGTIIKGFLLDKSADYISCHGHTVYHLPEEKLTKQIGLGGIIASLTKTSCMTDFRTQDIALGGVGTPLAPIVEKYLFPHKEYYLNLGGIANISIHRNDTILAFDICPFNQVLNFLSNKLGKSYDDKGLLAKNGKIIQTLLEKLDSTEYFKNTGPKSLDNNWIKKKFLPYFEDYNPNDALHTYCIWSAKEISRHIDKTKEDTLLITGGGTHNSFFIECLKEALKDSKIKIDLPTNEIIDFKEAILMALLGKLYLEDNFNVLSTVTGADQDSIGGALYKYKKKEHL